jgi:hypothetical protein
MFPWYSDEAFNMNKKAIYAAGASALTIVAFMPAVAEAACIQIPLQIIAANGSTITMSNATAADGNCKSFMDADLSSNLYSALTAPIPAGTNVIGFISNDPCNGTTKTTLPIASAATTFQLVAGVSGKQIYVCSFVAVVASASLFNIIEGTGATCVTANELAVVGSTTAASGMSLAAQGGFSQGSGNGTIMRTANSSNGLCVLQNGSFAVAGSLTYIQQ